MNDDVVQKIREKEVEFEALKVAAARSTIKAGPDGLLQQLVSMINSTDGTSVGITLQIGGLFVSGKLIAGDVFYKKFGQDLARVTGQTDDAAASIAEPYAELGKELYKKGDAASEELPGYLHLA